MFWPIVSTFASVHFTILSGAEAVEVDHTDQFTLDKGLKQVNEVFNSLRGSDQKDKRYSNQIMDTLLNVWKHKEVGDSEAAGAELKADVGDMKMAVDHELMSLLTDEEYVPITSAPGVSLGCHAMIGVSSSNSKTVTESMLASCLCPVTVDQSNWDGGHKDRDTFSVTTEIVSGSTNRREITVTRTDSDSGWGMNLQFQCPIAPISPPQKSNCDVVIGVSSSNSKTVTESMLGSCLCPVTVDQSNWDGGHKDRDTFSVTTEIRREITVTRTDSDSGWGMNLQFQCPIAPISPPQKSN